MSDILEVKNLSVRFKVNTGIRFFINKDEKFKVVINDVSFTLKEGETFGLVGETGSGKSTLAKTLVGIYKPF
ncbi:MAG: ATP-binding cassette domain-containing protein, partial [Thermoplasmata archaeon]